MNKKEIAEIKKQFSEDRSTIGRIASCYVDSDKNIRFTNVDAFASLQKEEELKYYDLFRKSMSGSIGANLYTMEFTIDAEKKAANGIFSISFSNQNSKTTNSSANSLIKSSPPTIMARTTTWSLPIQSTMFRARPKMDSILTIHRIWFTPILTL